MHLCSVVSQGWKATFKAVVVGLSFLLVLLVLPEAASPVTIEKVKPTGDVVDLKPDEEEEFKVEAKGHWITDPIDYIVFSAEGDPEKSGDEESPLCIIFCGNHDHKIKYTWTKIGSYEVTATVYSKNQLVTPQSVVWTVNVALPPPEIIKVVPDLLWKITEIDGVHHFATDGDWLVQTGGPPTTFEITAASDDKIDSIEFSSFGKEPSTKTWWIPWSTRTYSASYEWSSAGEKTVTATVVTGAGGKAVFNWRVKVVLPNQPPRRERGESPIRLGPLTVGEIKTLDMSEYFSDPDSDILTYNPKIGWNPGTIELGLWRVLSTVSGITITDLPLDSWQGSDFKLRIVPNKVGVATFTVTASDSEYSVEQSFSVVVEPPPPPPQNQAPQPVYSISSQTLTVGNSSPPLDVSDYFRDPDDYTLTYTAESNNPDVATVERVGPLVTITAISKGSTTVTVKATDSDGLHATQTIFVTVVENRAPTTDGIIRDQTLQIGDSSVPLDVSDYFHDPDDDTLIYVARTDDTAVVKLERNFPQITIEALEVGRTTVTIWAIDASGLFAAQSFTVTVQTAETVRLSIADSIIVQNITTLPLRIRSLPGTDTDLTIIGYVRSNGATGTITDGPREVDGHTWWRVKWDASDGVQWINQPADNAGWSVEAEVKTYIFRHPDTERQSFDLAIQSLKVSKTILAPDESFTLDVTIRNNGPGKSIAPGLSYYHSSIRGRTPTDPPQLQGTVWLDSLAPDESITKSIELKAPSTPRTYYYGAWLTANNGDTDIFNDVAAEIGVTVTPTLDGNTGICDRTPQVLNNILDVIGIDDCTDISQRDLSSITSLDISREGIIALQQGDFDGLNSLEELDLDGNSLSSLPIGIFDELSVLDTLELGSNDSLRFLPIGIFGELSALRRLYLNSNSLGSLPVGIFDGLGTLTGLYLQDNSLVSLPADVFDGLGALEILYLHKNDLSSLSVGVFDGLSALKTLRLSGNSLRSLPAGIFNGLNALRGLYLEDNQLTTLPKGVFDDLLDTLSSYGLDVDAPQKATLNFREITQDAVEGTTVKVTVDLSQALPVAVSVPYTVGGTATKADYNLRTQEELLFRAGETSKEIIFELLEDTDVAIETLVLTLADLGKIGLRKSDGSGIDSHLYSGQLLHPSNRRVHTVSVTSNSIAPSDDSVSRPLYWIDIDGIIYRSELDGTQAQVFLTSYDAEDIALDVSGGKLYWTDDETNNRRILRVNLDGSAVEQLVFDPDIDPDSIALDVSGGKMYWTDSWADKIQRANLDGAGVEDLVTDLNSPGDIALDVSGGKMYWTDDQAGKIQRANLNGSGVQDLVTGLRDPEGIALDVSGGKMYWTNYQADKIQRANLDGSGVEDLVTDISPLRIALDVLNGKMYWTDISTDKILRANLDGTQVEGLLTTDYPISIALAIPRAGMFNSAPWAVGTISSQTLIVGGPMRGIDVSDKFQDADGDRLTYAARSDNTAVATAYMSNAQVIIIPKGAGSATVTVTVNDGELTAMQTIAVIVKAAVKLIYWTEDDKIYQSKSDGTQRKVILVRAGKRLGRLALDVPRGKMYWTEFPPSGGTTTLQRANLDGSQIENVVLNVGTLTDLFLDALNSKLYWAAIVGRFEGSKIRRSNLDGSQAEDLVTNFNSGGIALFELLETLALDVLGGKMYWAEAAYEIREDNTVQILDTGKIRRSNLDGSEVEDLVTGLSSRALALDVLGDKMYWINNHASKIQRSNLDGSEVEDLVSAPGIGPFFNLALDVSDGKMYWGSTQVILRSNLDGTQAEILHQVTDPFSNIMGDIVFAILPEGTTHAAPSAASIALATALSKETGLLPNYPNPFNPETWIPYQLAEAADVKVSIYSVNGTLIRTLALGHQSIGVYHSRNRAAHWDGRNTFGERVASGLYFYTLTADDFTATRKMIIRK